MTIHDMRALIAECVYPNYIFHVTMDSRGAIYLQGEYPEPDTVTHNIEVQLTRRWFLSPAMTHSEIVQTVFKCVITSMEHRTREWFSYRGKPIFSPHFDVDALWRICEAEEFNPRPVTRKE